MTGSRLKDLLRSLWLEKSERDKQRLVGASNLSNECTRCLAEQMAAMLSGVILGESPVSKYIMGAKIGTAIHLYLEEQAKTKSWAQPETKVIVGKIEGYGVIKSTSDLYIKSLKAIVDHKTSTKAKVEIYRTLVDLDMMHEVPEIEPDTYRAGRKTVKRYLVQGNLYGLGCENRGDEVATVALFFIPRDSKTIDDTWIHEVDYDRDVAIRALDRGQRIWDALVAGKKLDTFKSDVDCYVCNRQRTSH